MAAIIAKKLALLAMIAMACRRFFGSAGFLKRTSQEMETQAW
jgi:hypothetical protein